MADKWYTAASGNWSTAANWNGGTLPAAGDDVYADGKAVVIDQTVNVGSIRTTQRSGGTIGGTFTVSTAQIITCTGSGIIGGTASNGAIVITATGTTTIVSNVTGGASGNMYGIYINGAGTVNVTGNVVGGSASSCVGIYINAAATLTLTGNATGGSQASAHGIINNTVSSVINITGNVTANVANGVNVVAGITGTNLSIIGTLTSSSTAAAVSASGLTVPVTVTGPFVNVNSYMAVYAQRIRIYASAVTSWTFQNESGTTKMLYSAGVSLGNPAEADVRNGTVYGASNELTGTLIVPSPSNVVDGVPTDHTVGTYSTTPALIAAAVVAELGSSTDPIAVRLQNVSTVQTTGNQIASYNI